MSTYSCENVDPTPLFSCGDYDAESNSFASDFNFPIPTAEKLPYDFELKWDANAKAIKLIFRKATETPLKAVIGNGCVSLNVTPEEFVGKTVWFTKDLKAPKSYIYSLESRSIQQEVLVSVTKVGGEKVRDYRIWLGGSLFFDKDGNIEPFSLIKFYIIPLEWDIVPPQKTLQESV